VFGEHKPNLGLKSPYERCDKEILGVVDMEHRAWA